MPSPEAPPIIDYPDALGAEDYRRGYIKCRLVHMEDRSFVMPDVLFSNGSRKKYFTPQFFQPNQIAFFGGDGAADFCRLTVELIGKVDVEVAFFMRALVRRCADNSFIYKCAFRQVDGKLLPKEAQGDWRFRRGRFEISVFHHTNRVAEAGINSSGEIWSSAWNIQGTTELKNVAYAYFTSLPRIETLHHLREVAMAEDGITHFLPTNAPMDAQFAVGLQVYRQRTVDRDRSLRFWVDVETVAPSHLWLHVPMSEPAYYEIVLPRVLRVGVSPGRTIPFKGMAITIRPEDCKYSGYVIVGNADTQEGLVAPYREEETQSLAKVDEIPPGSEIIARWHEKQNTHLYSDIDVELAELIEEET